MLTLILIRKPYATIFTRILCSAYNLFNVIWEVATAIFRFDQSAICRSDSLQAILQVI